MSGNLEKAISAFASDLPNFIEAISAASDLVELLKIRVEVMGKKGCLTECFKLLKPSDAEAKKQLGGKLNGLKTTFIDAYQAREQTLKAEEAKRSLASEGLDVSLPGRGVTLGGIHPVTQMRLECLSLLAGMGFEVVSGPEIEDTHHNFTALNMPAHHPARAMHDTFYVSDDTLLRTHSSTMQIRVMAHQQPPLRMVGAGRVYRCDHDQTHTPMFHQLEGMVIDRDVHMGHLKRLLTDLLKRLFGEQVLIRMRPSYFPFTEPSAEVDLGVADDSGQVKWLEVLGCGMVHPKVLELAGIDPETYQGFAFGMGLDRLTMIREGISDLRALFVGDADFLASFRRRFEV